MVVSKYDPLKEHLLKLREVGQTEARFSFEEIERIIQSKLPGSAYKFRQFWENEASPAHPQCRAWTDVGWHCSPDLIHKSLIFTRQATPAASLRGDRKPIGTQSMVPRTDSAPAPMRIRYPVLILSPCTSKKRDDIPIESGGKVIRPEDYLGTPDLLKRLKDTRVVILDQHGAHRSFERTYAFDLYVRTGNAYRDIKSHASTIKELLLQEKVSWFFLSAGYGVVHALERVGKYEAQFAKKAVLNTAGIWSEAGLSSICDAIIQKYNPASVYVFGNRDYTRFIKESDSYRHQRDCFYICNSCMGKALGRLVTTILKDTAQECKQIDHSLHKG